MIEHKNIDEAILAITTEGDLYIQKQKKNQGVGYKYASEGDFLEKMRPQLANHGIICTPRYRVVSSTITIVKPANERENAKILRLVLIEGTFTWTHAPSGTHRITGAVGEGADNQDKASYKAMTGAQKYAIRQTFQIETGDDPEKDDAPPARTETDVSPPISRFESDLYHERRRLGPDVYQAAIKEFLPDATRGYDLLTLTGPQKKELIAFLRGKP